MKKLIIKIDSKSILNIALCIYLISYSLFWDTRSTRLGFVLINLSFALVILYDCRYRFAGFSRILHSSIFWWLLLLLSAMLITIGNITVVNRTSQYIKMIIMLETIFIFGSYFIHAWDRTKFAKICIFAAFILCAWVVNHEFAKIINLSLNSRVGYSAAGSNPNVVGILLGYFSSVALYEFVCRKKLRYLLPTLIMYCFMLLTGSKKILIFMVISMVVLMFMKSRKNKLFKLLIIIFGIVIAYNLVMNVSILYDILGVRINRTLMALGITGYQQDTSTTERLSYIKMAFDYWKQKPIFGYGFQAFTYTLGVGTYSHNNYMEMLVSYGAVGFVIYYSLYILSLIKLFRIRKYEPDADLFIMLIIIYLLNDYGAVTYYDMMVNYVILCGSWSFIIKQQQPVKLRSTVKPQSMVDYSV